MEDGFFKRVIVIVILTVIGGKLFASFMIKVAEDTSTKAKIAHFIPNNFFSDTQAPGVVVPAPHYAPNHNFVAPVAVKPNVAPPTHPATLPMTVATTTTPKKQVETPEAAAKRRKKMKKAQEEALSKNSTPIQPQAPKFTVILNPETPTSLSYSGGAFNPNTTQTTQGTNKNAPTTSSAPAAHPPGVDIASWTNILVHSPDARYVRQFYSLYVSKQITDQQFYSVLGFMQKSNVLDARKFASIMAARQQREESLKILAPETLIESDSALRSSAIAEVAKYQNTSQLQSLQSALSNGDIYEKIVASDLVGKIATQFSTENSASEVQAKQLFEPFVAIFDSMLKDSSDVQAHSAASSALAAVNSVLKTTVTTAQN